jgi:hypothetical protein
MRSLRSSSATCGAGSDEPARRAVRVNAGMVVGIAGLVLGLPLLLVGVRLVYGSAVGSPRRRRGVMLIVVGFGMVWIGGFIGAFSSL